MQIKLSFLESIGLSYPHIHPNLTFSYLFIDHVDSGGAASSPVEQHQLTKPVVLSIESFLFWQYIYLFMSCYCLSYENFSLINRKSIFCSMWNNDSLSSTCNCICVLCMYVCRPTTLWQRQQCVSQCLSWRLCRLWWSVNNRKLTCTGNLHLCVDKPSGWEHEKSSVKSLTRDKGYSQLN